MNLLKREREALAALLEQGAENPEKLAVLVAAELDKLRGERTTYVSIVRVGTPPNVVFVGMGPFATKGQAGKAIEKSPYEGTAYATVPTRSPEGYEQLLAELDEKPASKGDFALVQEDVQRFKQGWRGNRKDAAAFPLKKGAWG